MLIDTDKLREAISRRDAERCQAIERIEDDAYALDAYTKAEEWAARRTEIVEAVEDLARELGVA